MENVSSRDDTSIFIIACLTFLTCDLNTYAAIITDDAPSIPGDGSRSDPDLLGHRLHCRRPLELGREPGTELVIAVADRAVTDRAATPPATAQSCPVSATSAIWSYW